MAQNSKSGLHAERGQRPVPGRVIRPQGASPVGEAPRRSADDARQRSCGACAPYRLVQGLPSSGRARPRCNGRTLRCRDDLICHETTGDPGDTQHCAGALIFHEKLGRPNWRIRFAALLGLFDPSRLHLNAPVVDTVADFVRIVSDLWLSAAAGLGGAPQPRFGRSHRGRCNRGRAGRRRGRRAQPIGTACFAVWLPWPLRNRCPLLPSVPQRCRQSGWPPQICGGVP